MSLPLERLSINTATISKQWRLDETIDNLARLDVPAIAPWRHEVADIGLDRTARLLRDAGLVTSSYCRAGMFPYNSDGERERILADNFRAVDEAVALRAECLIVVSGGLPEGSKDLVHARECVLDILGELAPYAHAAGMPVAIEPLHPMYAADRCCVNTIAHALDICDQLGPGVGVAIDVYHVWWDRDLFLGMQRAGADRIMSVHLSDWLRDTRDLLTDRGMMGDGIIDIAGIRRTVQDIGYDGWYEVEIFSERDWWQRPADEVIATCKERFASAC